jgi:RNA polymerase sigma-70 factor (ECF subfamily)
VTDSPAGPRERFDTLYRQHREPVLAFLLRRTEQPDDAADVLHDVFTTAWRRIDEIPDGDAARMWLFGVAYRALANHRRSRHRRNRLIDALTHALSTVFPASPGHDHTELHEALQTLSSDDQAVLTLNAWEGLTPTEIGAVVGLDPRTVRVRLHRARQRLRAKLTPPHATTSSRHGGGRDAFTQAHGEATRHAG